MRFAERAAGRVEDGAFVIGYMLTLKDGTNRCSIVEREGCGPRLTAVRGHVDLTMLARLSVALARARAVPLAA